MLAPGNFPRQVIRLPEGPGHPALPSLGVAAGTNLFYPLAAAQRAHPPVRRHWRYCRACAETTLNGKGSGPRLPCPKDLAQRDGIKPRGAAHGHLRRLLHLLRHDRQVAPSATWAAAPAASMPLRRQRREGATAPGILAPAVVAGPHWKGIEGVRAHTDGSGGSGSAATAVEGAAAGLRGGAAGLVRLVNSWPEATELLELLERLGGPPPPRVQLRLLQRSRSFGLEGGNAGRAGGVGATGGVGGIAFAVAGRLEQGFPAGESRQQHHSGGLEGADSGLDGTGVGDAWTWLRAVADESPGDAGSALADTTGDNGSGSGPSSSTGPTAAPTTIASSTTTAGIAALMSTAGAGEGSPQGAELRPWCATQLQTSSPTTARLRQLQQQKGSQPHQQRQLDGSRMGTPEGGAAAPAMSTAAAGTAARLQVAEDAVWRVEWDLQWTAQIHRHAHWLLQGPLSDAAATGAGALPATSAAVAFLPGLAAAAHAGPQCDPIPPLQRRTWAPDVPYSAQQQQQQRQQQQQQQQQLLLGEWHQQGRQPGVQGDAGQHSEAHGHLAPLMRAYSPLPATSASLEGPGRPPAGRVTHGTVRAAQPRRHPAAAARLVATDSATDAQLAASVLARIVYDATVVQPDAWTDAQIGVLLRSAAKLSYRYPDMLQPPSELQLVIGQPATGTVASSRIGSSPETSAAMSAVQLRVRLQQLLLRLDGLLASPPPRRGNDGDATASLKAPRTGMAQCTGPNASATDTTTNDGALRGGVGDGEAATVTVSGLPLSAAVSAVWAAATLQLRLSTGGGVRRCLLSAFLRPWRRRRLLLQDNQWEGQQHQQRRRRGWQGARGRQPRLWLRPLGASGAAAAVASAKLPPGELAEMLWALATLEIQMPTLWTDSVLRALAAAGLKPPATTAWHRRSHARKIAPCSQPALQTTARAAAGAAAAASAEVAEVATTMRGVVNGGCSAGRSGGGGGAAVVMSPPHGAGLLTAVQVTRVAWAVVELQAAVGKDDVTRPWAGHLFASTQGRLQRLSASQLVDLLWSVARGRRLPSGPWRRALAAALAGAIPQLLPWQVARAMAGMGKLRLCMTYRVVAGLLRAMLSRLDAAQPSDVAALVWALRFVSRPYTDVFVRTHRRDLLDLAAATRPLLASLEPPQLVQLADGFAHLGLLPGAEWLRLHREACIRLKPRFSEANRRKLRHAYAIFYML